MDNDLKIVKPEVKLFLGDQVCQSNINSVSTYDLDKEYAKTRKNKSVLSISILSITAIVVVLFSIIFSNYIKIQNEKITVSVEAFDDLNLKKLLDSVSRLENELNLALAEKKSIEEAYVSDKEKAEQQRDADLYTLHSMRLTSIEFSKQRTIINDQCRRSLAFIEAAYKKDITDIDEKIAEISTQLAAMDSANLERAQAQQAELDSQAQVYELEKQKIIDEYEASVAELKRQLQVQKQLDLSERNHAIDKVAAKYQAEIDELNKRIDALDPVISDPEADAIVQEAALFKVTSSPNFAAIAARSDLSERDVFLLNSLQRKFQNQSYLLKYISALPHENTIPQYSKAMRAFGNSIGDDALQLIANMLTTRSNAQQTTVTLETLIDSYSYFIDSQLKTTGDSGFVMDPRNASAVVVYISPLFSSEIKDTKAYVFRKADEFIGTVTLKKNGAKIVAVPETAEMKMMPGDRIMIDFN